MKKMSIVVAFLMMIMIIGCNNQSKKSSSTQIITQIDSVSYALGLNIGRSFKEQVPEINREAFFRAISDILDSSESFVILEADIQKVIQPYFVEKQKNDLKKREKENETLYADVKINGEKFLEENKMHKGVITTESGLQYEVIKKGKGKSPGATSTVKVHYHGTTPEGLVFDSSVERKKSVSFPLSSVIRGWTEGIQLMKEGAKYKFYIPQELAYGANPPQGGQGPIKPYMPLVFEVELIKIEK